MRAYSLTDAQTRATTFVHLQLKRVFALTSVRVNEHDRINECDRVSETKRIIDTAL